MGGAWWEEREGMERENRVMCVLRSQSWVGLHSFHIPKSVPGPCVTSLSGNSQSIAVYALWSCVLWERAPLKALSRIFCESFVVVCFLLLCRVERSWSADVATSSLNNCADVTERARKKSQKETKTSLLKEHAALNSAQPCTSRAEN